MTKPTVFISYVREDASAALWIAEHLAAVGAEVWIDHRRLLGGDDWEVQIAAAIPKADHFVALFSSNWIARISSVANQELNLAVAERQRRGHGSRYLIPVKINECEIPDQRILASLSMSGVNYIKFYSQSLGEAMHALGKAIGIDRTWLDDAEPLAVGLPARLKITGGAMQVVAFNPPVPPLIGSEKQVQSGEIFRDCRGAIQAHVIMRTPFVDIEQVDSEQGINQVTSSTMDAYLSTDPAKPSLFRDFKKIVLPKGRAFRSSPMGPIPPMPFDLPATIDMRIEVCVKPPFLVGRLVAIMTYSPPGRTVTFTETDVFQATYEGVRPANN